MLFLSSSLLILRVVLVSVSSADITDCCNTLEREVVTEAGEKPVKPLTSVLCAATERRIMKEEKTLFVNIMKEYEQAEYAMAGYQEQAFCPQHGGEVARV